MVICHLLYSTNYYQRVAICIFYFTLINCKRYVINLFCVSVSTFLYASISSNNFGSELELMI